MIQPSDLRLGNIVMNVSDNGKQPVKLWRVTSISQTRVVCQSGTDQKVFKPSCLQGVILTEDHLKEMGFDDKTYKPGYIGIDVKAGGMTTDWVISKPGRMGDFQQHYAWEFQAGKIHLYNDFQYIHELQNLFHTINQKELTIKID